MRPVEGQVFGERDEIPGLRGRAVRGVMTVAGVQGAHFALSLVSTALLARLLMPRDFGLLVMVGAVSNFLVLFRDLGLSSATVQQSSLIRSHVNALFWINVALGLVVAATLAATASAIAGFFGQPELRGIAQALGVGIAVAGLGAQHGALLRRQMRFAALGGVEIAAHIAGIVAAVVAALSGAGFWALVTLQLVQQATATIGLWIASGFRPSWPPVFAGVRSQISFGTGLTGFNVLTYVSRNLDNIIVGRTAGTAALGLYSKAYSLLLLPVDRVRGPISAVVVPALSRLQHDPDRFRRAYLRALTAAVAAGMPAVVFLFVFAEEAVAVLLGSQWRESVLLFQVLAPAAFVETFNMVGSWACLPLGRPGRLVRWQVFATATMAGAFLVGANWGATGVAVGFSISTLALRIPALLYLLHGSPIRPADVLRTLARPAVASIAAGVLLYALRGRALLMLSPATILIGAMPIYLGAYMLLMLLPPGGRRDFQEITALVRESIPIPGMPLPRTNAGSVAQ